MIGFFKEIKEEYNSGRITKYINDKYNKLFKLEEDNYEQLIKYFLEKFHNIFCKKNEKKDNLEIIKYNYFYIDLILGIQQLTIFNNNSELIYRIISKVISSSISEISKKNSIKLIDNNIFILEALSNSKLNIKNEEYIYIFIKYALDFSNYLLDFMQSFQYDYLKTYKLILQLFNKLLLIELENNFEKYKITNSNSTIVLLMKLQDIQLFILNKINKNNYYELKNKDTVGVIINLNKIYDKYQIKKEENSLTNKIFIFELDNLLPKFIDILNNNEVEIIYGCLTNFICSINHNIRNGAKKLLKLFIQKNLIILENRDKNKK